MSTARTSSKGFCTIMADNYVITVDAAVELKSIAEYIADSLGSPAASDDFVVEFRESLRRICIFPESRPLCADPVLSSRGYRSFRVKGYIALYVYSDGIIYVDHVFHQSQNYAALVGN